MGMRMSLPVGFNLCLISQLQEKPDTEPEIKPEVNQEEKIKNTFETVCVECGETFQAQSKTRLFCSAKHKTTFCSSDNL